ncbi:MAG: phosphoesterase PA-phosphatase related [Hyphomicrobiales bacterium]|nr:phosphoesterase PA-phosphatase related [Hyphomicrobiales bacterium]
MIRSLRARIGKIEKRIVVSMALVAAGAGAFVALADEAMEGGTRGFDTRILLALRNAADLSDPIGPEWFEEMMRDFTALGGVGVLTLVSLALMTGLILQGKRHAAVMAIAAIVSGMALSQSLKWGFARPRPDLVPHGARVYTQSFPSGHAMMSAIVYLTWGALLARTQDRLRVKSFIIAVAVCLTLLIGCSRVYLGVHWPTDVLAGWSGGAAWAVACWIVMAWLQQSGSVEEPGPAPATPADVDAPAR